MLRKKSDRTPAQQELVQAKSKRGKFKAEAVAFYEALIGLPLDVPVGPKRDRHGNVMLNKDGKPRVYGARYRKFRAFAAEAIRCAETGDKANREKFGKHVIYKRYVQMLERAAVLKLTGMAANSMTTLASPSKAAEPKKSKTKAVAKAAVKAAPVEKLDEAQNEDRGWEEYLDGATTLEARMTILGEMDSNDERTTLVAERPEWAPALEALEAELAAEKATESTVDVSPSPKVVEEPTPKDTSGDLVSAIAVRMVPDPADQRVRDWAHDHNAWLEGGCQGPEPSLSEGVPQIEQESLVKMSRGEAGKHGFKIDGETGTFKRSGSSLSRWA
jgi:hypothetical protein